MNSDKRKKVMAVFKMFNKDLMILPDVKLYEKMFTLCNGDGVIYMKNRVLIQVR